MKTLRRTIHPEVRVLDSKSGTVEYIASDETLDSYREVIRADGWRFTHFAKNAPLIADHEYRVEMLLGRILDFRVEKKRLVETAQFAVDVKENEFPRKTFAMVEAGFLKAVSVGFWPIKQVGRWDQNQNDYNAQLDDLGLSKADDSKKPRTIYTEQEQIELSVVVVGANPNALARARVAGILSDADLEQFSSEYERHSSLAATDGAHAAEHRAHQRRSFLDRLQQIIKNT